MQKQDQSLTCAYTLDVYAEPHILTATLSAKTLGRMNKIQRTQIKPSEKAESCRQTRR